jgi:transcriptional regulator
MSNQADLMPGTLDLLILQAVSLGEFHGDGVLLRIEQISGGALAIQQGSLYPALARLEHQGLIESTWGTSENNRRAKFYRITAAERRRRGEEEAGWKRLVAAMSSALNAQPGKVC